jgi:serine/threonine protein phosphatase PrpC
MQVFTAQAAANDLAPAVPQGPAAGPHSPALAANTRSLKTPFPAAAPVSDLEMELELDGPAAAIMPTPPVAVEPLPPTGFCCDVGSATSSGRLRSRNEDSYLVQQLAWCNLDQRHNVALVVVADGMGGYDAGDQASGLVIRTVADGLAGLFAKALAAKTAPQPTENADAIDKALKEANRVVVQQGQSDANSAGMGATAVVVLIWDDVVQIGHVGDCRVYHWRGPKLTQVTRDQTFVARMVELGKLTPAEALVHPQRNEVTQAIGKHAQLQPAAYPLRLNAGDWLVIACDGLHAHVDGPMLSAALQQAPASAGSLAQQLVDLANQRGGSDNCTVVAVRCW